MSGYLAGSTALYCWHGLEQGAFLNYYDLHSVDLIDEMIRILSRWDKYESYYLGSLFPRIAKGDIPRGSVVEGIAYELRSRLMPADFSRLPQMVSERRAGRPLEISDIQYLERERIRKREEELERVRKEQKHIAELKYKEEEPERQKREEFLRYSEDLFKQHINCSLDQPLLDDQDIRLAIKWWDQDLPQIPSRESLIKDFGRKDKNNLARLLSARLAEKAAIEFYRAYGFQVEDVSIQQVTNSKCPNWMDYDLNVDGDSVDVKNSRKSQYNPNSYTEHYIRKFKHNSINQQVRVCGVFSPYLHADKLLDTSTDQRNKLFILGETTLTDQLALKSEFEESELLQIELSRQSGGTTFFLPPWMFSYPKWAYKNRDDLLEKASGIAIPDTQSCKTAGINPIPLCIAAGVDLRQYWQENDLSLWEWEFFHKLSERLGRHGLSLPILFLSVLEHFLLMVTRPPGNTNGYIPVNYKKFIFDNDRLNVPLGIDDPLKTIDVLVDCLNTLWTAEHDLIRNYKAFKLQGFNILRAKSSPKGQWETLIAYCGGSRNNAACGKNPLVLGKCKHCPICGYLICPDCNFCSPRCTRVSQPPFYDFPEDIHPDISLS